jgi:ABC-type sugar transport system ATPase subunit
VKNDATQSISSSTAAADHPLLGIADVRKSFGPTTAVKQCSFDVGHGEVHAIVGENGCGKSTLVKLLGGVHRPDAGTLHFDGIERDFFASPRAAIASGVVVAFQEILIVESQSILANVWLGADGLVRRARTPDDRRRTAEATLRALLGDTVDLDAPAGGLSLNGRQACGIARALLRGPRILLLDEATSALDRTTRDRLFVVLREFVSTGNSVIFISHRMDEIEEIADRITVMRSGESIATLSKDEATADVLIRHMTGAARLTAGSAVDRASSATGAAVLEVTELTLRRDGTPVTFQLRAGEMVGLAGLEGQGQEEFLRALCGRLPDRGQSAILGAGRRPVTSPQVADDLGIAYLPRDRRAHSLFANLSVRENFAAASLRDDAWRGILTRRRQRRRMAEFTTRVGVNIPDDSLPITTLSGGNQQKVILGRWLVKNPVILLLNDPMRGIDIGAKRDLYRLLVSLVEQGVGIVMLSTEVDELVELMDRVLVFRDGTLGTEIPRVELTRETLVASFFGDTKAVS